jgi:nucleoside-diphosphate-sugar epimerase
MNVFLTGATGYIGSAVAQCLLEAGHAVTGLARSAESEQRLAQMGVEAVRGDLASIPSLMAAASMSEGVIHAGTTNDGAIDAAAITAMLSALKGSGKPFVYTSGVWILGNTGDRVADETSPVSPAALAAWRPGVEQMTMAAASGNVRAMVIRPGIVFGRGRGIPADFVRSARETGAAKYVGDGSNHWPVIHVDDLARLYVVVLERGASGAIYLAGDGSAYTVKEIAQAASLGAGADGRTESWPLDEARQQLGAYADALVLDQRISAEKAKRELGWSPQAPSILDYLRSRSHVA